MAAQLKQLVHDEFKPIVLVSASPAAIAALERNKLSFAQLFAPHADAPLPAGAGYGREGSAFVKYEGPLTVRYVNCSSANYAESEQEAEASLVQALTQHNDVSSSCARLFAVAQPLTLCCCRRATASALRFAAATRRRKRRSTCTRATCLGSPTLERR